MKKAIVLLAFFALMVFFLPTSAQSAVSKFKNWGEVAEAMRETLEKAYDSYSSGSPDDSFDWVNSAYFDFYEKEGFERNVKGRISGKRCTQVEYKFGMIKQKIRKGAPKEEIRADLDILITWLMEDADSLDGRTAAQAQAQAQAQTQTSGQTTIEPAAPVSSGRDWAIFFAAFGTLLREGFEAILVIAAIAAYLTRAGFQKSVPTVYWASAAAIVVSGLAAVALQLVFQNLSGAKQEVIEGLTMLLATVVLFCVSNWMFSKAEAEAWKRYIETKVKQALTAGSTFALAAAAFLAVFREGAETILFYQGILTEADGATGMVWGGFAVGCVALVIVFIIIRYGSMRLPLKPFFLWTSILMFIMAIAFVGGGIKELQEGDALSITFIEGFPTVELLGIFPTVQTLVPQIVLVLLTILSIVVIRRKNRRLKLAAA
ncbi:MAG: FTR1 family iron permease [Deltaproteobacteria bacterium]|nr:FTR1 family iron permease [Deltaproteobacteria bacterium]